jgi:hypothetical protein
MNLKTLWKSVLREKARREDATPRRLPGEKTPGPHGITLEMRKIPKRTIVVLHEQRKHTTPRYKALGGVPNRATRRAFARGRGIAVPAPTMLPYERPVVGTDEYEAQVALYAKPVQVR